ncbi:rod shape-determining protein MreC [Calothrix sp. 336/3]|uniref:rod shape-determining protein MreC n=1 Tax=Calothrix sp. 336/3 TaxID=1337936 RepID=UPI0004E388A9|nr:rod shape-determining protein MreC [Calothrix sp. 336/3]AKG22842.1 rod shape-determining protein MreC [Calothrix sp. 336/3]
MFTARRWWEHKGVQIGIVALAIGGAWAVRQTQGTVLLEIYQGIGRQLQVFQTGPAPEESIRNARILELETRITELAAQNQKLKELLKYVDKEPLASRPIPARVVGRSGDNWWQQVTLNRGTNDGIQEGYIVKGEGGLVGLVKSVTPNTSRVLLISDLQSRVGVNVSRTGAKGILRGDSSSEAILEFSEKVPNVKVGDFVATSNYSQRFPSGLAVGRIKSLDLKKVPTSIAKVDLFPAIRSLDWVSVYPKPVSVDSEAQESQQKPAEQSKIEKSN